jgi:hypothetical protein
VAADRELGNAAEDRRRTVTRRLTVLAGIVTMAAAAGVAGAEEPVPSHLTLRTLANLHPPVELDHAAHAEIAGDCASCHHQPFGEPEPCASCHVDPVKPSAFVHELHWEIEDCTGCHHRPATAELRCIACHPVEPDPSRLEVIGLKGAYHGLCLRCHGETGSDASCALCHPDR